MNIDFENEVLDLMFQKEGQPMRISSMFLQHGYNIFYQRCTKDAEFQFVFEEIK